MKCLIIDAVHSAIAEELGKYMQVDTHMLPTQEELEQIYSVMSDIREQVGYGEVPLDSPPPPQVRLEEALSGSQSGA